MTNVEGVTRIRTRATAWFALVVFARLYTGLLNDFLGRIVGLEFISFTWIHGIPSYLWIEIIFYGPLMWLALHQVNADVFGDLPTEPEALRRHRRRQFVGEIAIAILIYGVGVHAADAIEVLSREREHITEGAVYELVYFLDEGLSHYIQFVPLFFVMGWILIHDRPGRTAHATIALFLGVAHGVERAVGIIEAEKWFLAPAVVIWMGTAAWLRWRAVGPAAAGEFFFRHAVAFCLTVPVTAAAYYGWFHSFPPPSGLNDSELVQMAAGAVALTVAGTALVTGADRWWHKRQLVPVKLSEPSSALAAAE